MSGKVNVFGPVIVSGVSDGGATETVIATLTGVNSGDVQRRIILSGFVNSSPGTDGTDVVLKVRRGTTTGGTQIGSSLTSIAVATHPITIPFTFEDNTFPLFGASYVLTVTVTAAEADGTVNFASLQAIAAG